LRGLVSASTITMDSKGTLYVITSSSKKAAWKYENGKWVETNLKALEDTNALYITELIAGVDDTIYALAADKGVWRYDGRAWTDISGSSGWHVQEYFSESVNGIAQDKNGDLYAVKNGGVYKYNGSDWMLTGGP